MQDVQHIQPVNTSITSKYNTMLQGLLGGQGIADVPPSSMMQIVPYNKVVYRVQLLQAQLSQQLNIRNSVSFID